MSEFYHPPIWRCTWCCKDTATAVCEHCNNEHTTVDRTRPHQPHWSRATISTVECKVCDRSGPYSIQLEPGLCHPEVPLTLRCQNCGHEDLEEALPSAKNIDKRHELGVMFSDRECPKCGALCYPTVPLKTDLRDLRLVRVSWGGDEGIVAQNPGVVLVYAYGKRLQFCPDKGMPFVEITDDEIGDEANWEDVPEFLRRLPASRFLIKLEECSAIDSTPPLESGSGR